MGRIWFVLVALLALMMPIPASAETPPLVPAHTPSATRIHLAELTVQAEARNLASQRQWHRLLHYAPNLMFPGVHSLTDAPDFFLAATGKTDPRAELAATLASFFSDIEETDKQQHPQCRFIARYRWLKQELGFDPARLPEQSCARFHHWRNKLNPDQLALIFPAAFLNSPASMFGHTLLRIDTPDQNERTRLLAYAVNYAAATDETSGLQFAYRGLFGGYPGVFALMPYYLKVQEYNDIEHRDIWEYELTFTPDELERLLEHLWELGPMYFDYYFFDENCSYHLLSLFEVARPTLDLTSRFRWWAIPSDTVAVVTEQPGLVKKTVFRPAAATVLRHRVSQLPVAQHVLIRDLASGRTSPDDAQLATLAPAEQAAVIETAYEYANYRKLSTHEDSDDSQARSRALLLARSCLPPAEPSPVPMPAIRPDQGHASARIAFGIGREGGRGAAEIRLRPAYHDLLDPEAGFNRGSQVEFFALTLRREAGDRLRVEEFRPIDIFSLAPRDEFFQPLSWKASAGWTRKIFSDGTRALVVRANGAAGFAWELNEPDTDSLAYALIDGVVDAADEYDHGYAVGLGPTVGWIKDLSSQWRLHLYATARRFGIGPAHTDATVSAAMSHAIGRNMSVRAQAVREREFDRYSNRAQLAWMVYF